MNNVRPIKVPINLDKRRYIVFDLNAFAKLDEIYGNKHEALLSLQSGLLRHVRVWLWAGLLHEGEDLTVEDVGQMFTLSKKENIEEITNNILQSASANLPQAKPGQDNQPMPTEQEINTGWDWDWMYYMGTTLLGMKEDEFWRSTVRKLFALWDVHVRVNGLGKQESDQKTSAPPGYIDQFI